MSRAQRRYLRTVLLAIAAMGTLVWAAVHQFAISWAEVRQLFIATVIGVLLVIALAGAGVAVWAGIRRLLRRD